jgi:hypothetical protein
MAQQLHPQLWQLECLRSRKAGEDLDMLAERIAGLPGALPAWRAAFHAAHGFAGCTSAARAAGAVAAPPRRMSGPAACGSEPAGPACAAGQPPAACDPRVAAPTHVLAAARLQAAASAAWAAFGRCPESIPDSCSVPVPLG